jgi:hypothetical protein
VPEPPGEATPARQHWTTRLQVDRGDDSDNFLTAMTRWIVSAARALPVTPAANRPSFAALSSLAEQSGAGTIVAFRSPYAEDRTATVVTAADPGQLEVAVAALVQPAVWDRLDGDVTMWDSSTGAVLSHQVAAPYVIDPIDTSLGHMVLIWRTYMAKHQGAWLLLVFAAVAGLSLLTGFLLRRMAR